MRCLRDQALQPAPALGQDSGVSAVALRARLSVSCARSRTPAPYQYAHLSRYDAVS